MKKKLKKKLCCQLNTKYQCRVESCLELFCSTCVGLDEPERCKHTAIRDYPMTGMTYSRSPVKPTPEGR